MKLLICKVTFEIPYLEMKQVTILIDRPLVQDATAWQTAAERDSSLCWSPPGECPARETAAALFEVSNNSSLAHSWS